MVGQLLHLLIFEACSVFTHIKACLLANRRYATSTSKAPTALLLPLPFRLLPAGTTSCRTGLFPAKDQRLFTAHIQFSKNTERAKN
jgi:hypothetical protein